ncbi:MAG: hypothetical protein GXY86_09355 [Firmicutes bacterium]|nr:hypothetical protein [Bacillota bacterium]
MNNISKKNLESQKLIEHIEDAKGWLDKAKEYYRQANPIHAEMTLNLAQAEVKHVWELSRGRYVSNKQTTFAKRKFNHLITVAASILVFFGLVFGIQKSHFPKYLAGLLNRNEEKVFIGSAPKTTSIAVNNDQKVPEVDSSKAIQGELDDSVEPVSRVAETNEQNRLGTAIVAVETQPERTKSENIQPQRVRQVSQFAIDEEALTKEASHSLRNGK